MTRPLERSLHLAGLAGRSQIAALLMALCLVLLQGLGLAAPSPPPTTEDVSLYIEPLVRARLRVPDSLQDFAIAAIERSTEDPARFEVEVRFRARTPFGAVTDHALTFAMKRSSSGRVWIVTSE